MTNNGTLTVPRLRLLGNGILNLTSDTALDVVSMVHSRLGGTGTVTVSDTLRFAAASGLHSVIFAPGELVVAPGAEVEVLGGTLRQQGFNEIGGTDTGRYAVAGGARLEFTGSIRTLAASGVIGGTGTVVLGNDFQPLRGPIWPGNDDAAAVTTVEGTFPKPHAEGAVEIRLGGPTVGQDFSQLAVTGQAYLGGSLRVLLADGYTPTEGDRFRVVQGTIHHIENAFDALDLPAGLSGFVEVVEGGADFVVGAPVSTDPVPSEPLAFTVVAPSPTRAAPRPGWRSSIPKPGRYACRSSTSSGGWCSSRRTRPPPPESTRWRWTSGTSPLDGTSFE